MTKKEGQIIEAVIQILETSLGKMEPCDADEIVSGAIKVLQTISPSNDH